MSCDSHLCLSLFHLPFVKCGIIYALARSISSAWRDSRNGSEAKRFLADPGNRSGVFSWRKWYGAIVREYTYILYIYIHTSTCNYHSYLATGDYIKSMSSIIFKSETRESDGKSKRRRGREKRKESKTLVRIFPSPFCILLRSKFQSSHCAQWPAEKRASKPDSQILCIVYRRRIRDNFERGLFCTKEAFFYRSITLRIQINMLT